MAYRGCRFTDLVQNGGTRNGLGETGAIRAEGDNERLIFLTDRNLNRRPICSVATLCGRRRRQNTCHKKRTKQKSVNNNSRGRSARIDTHLSSPMFNVCTPVIITFSWYSFPIRWATLNQKLLVITTCPTMKRHIRDAVKIPRCVICWSIITHVRLRYVTLRADARLRIVRSEHFRRYRTTNLVQRRFFLMFVPDRRDFFPEPDS